MSPLPAGARLQYRTERYCWPLASWIPSLSGCVEVRPPSWHRRRGLHGPRIRR